jgi:hypothetical protein
MDDSSTSAESTPSDSLATEPRLEVVPPDPQVVQTVAATPSVVDDLAVDPAPVAVVAGADAATTALEPATSLPVATQTPATTGPKGKIRSPIGGWLLLIPTLGIYYLFWYFNINRELRDYDPSVNVSPGWAVVSLFIPVVGLISIYNTGNRIRQAQTTAGAPSEASGLLGLIASIFLVLDIPYYNVQLNKVWQHG